MLELHNIRRTFNPGTANEFVALNGINLKVENGSFVVVAGSNGSGKSMLLNIIAGSQQPDHGTIEFSGVDVTAWSEYRRASLVGRVFQDPFTGTAPQLTVAENLALALNRGQTHGLGRAVTRRDRGMMRDRIAQLRLGLEDRLDSPMGILSGGQRQALTLLMATWVKPELLLLDEHTAALDPKSAERILLLTEEVIARERLTVLMVTHSMQQAVHMGNRVVMMHRGRIVRDFENRSGRLRSQELLHVFEELRRDEQLDETAAELLQATFI